MGFGIGMKPIKGRPKKHWCACYHNVFPNPCNVSPALVRNTSSFLWMGGDTGFYCTPCWTTCMMMEDFLKELSKK